MKRKYVTKPMKFPIYKHGKIIRFEEMRVMIRNFHNTAEDPEEFDLFCFTNTVGFHLFIHGPNHDGIYYRWGFNCIEKDYYMNRQQLQAFSYWMNRIDKKENKSHLQLILEKWYEVNKDKGLRYTRELYESFFDDNGEFISIDFTEVENLQHVGIYRMMLRLDLIFSDRGIFKFTRSNWFYCIRHPISAFRIRFCK